MDEVLELGPVLYEKVIGRVDYCAQIADGTIFCVRQTKNALLVSARCNDLVVRSKCDFDGGRIEFVGVRNQRVYFRTVEDETVSLFYCHVGKEGKPEFAWIDEIPLSTRMRPISHGYLVRQNREGDITVFDVDYAPKRRKVEVFAQAGPMDDVMFYHRGKLISVQHGLVFQVCRTQENVLCIHLPSMTTKIMLRDYLPYIYIINSEDGTMFILDVEKFPIHHRTIRLHNEDLANYQFVGICNGVLTVTVNSNEGNRPTTILRSYALHKQYWKLPEPAEIPIQRQEVGIDQLQTELRQNQARCAELESENEELNKQMEEQRQKISTDLERENEELKKQLQELTQIYQRTLMLLGRK